MEEQGTFSALVDAAKTRSGRVDREADILSYARVTMRECLVLSVFDQSLVEDQITATASPHIWTRPNTLRNMLIVKYPYWDRQGKPIYPAFRTPKTIRHDDRYYFYVSGSAYIFAGIAIGDVIDVAYYEYFTKLRYYASATDRPARFDAETNIWTYTDAYDDTEATQEQARNLVTNWLLFHWYDLVLEGTLAKIFKLVGDERAPATYALYKAMQKDLLAGEAQTYVGK